MYARRAQVGPVLSNQHPQDFIYCRLYVSDKETARQDDIRREFGMGLAFASEALDLGGRVLICCPTGCRLAVAATVALLMQKRGMRLSTAYGVVKLHEPALQLSRALARIESAPVGAMILVVAHHPLIEMGTRGTARTRRGAAALTALATAGAQAVLTGHVHDAFDVAYPVLDRTVRLIGAGTLSERVRDSRPSFNALRIDSGQLDVSVREMA